MHSWSLVWYCLLVIESPKAKKASIRNIHTHTSLLTPGIQTPLLEDCTPAALSHLHLGNWVYWYCRCVALDDLRTWQPSCFIPYTLYHILCLAIESANCTVSLSTHTSSEHRSSHHISLYWVFER
jgi:hypothetical protein